MRFGNFSEEVKSKIAENLYNFTIEFKKVFGLDCFLAYGTLLGAVREKDFISHDNDMDIHYLSKYNDVQSIMQESREIWEYFELQKRAIFKSASGKGLQMHVAFRPNLENCSEGFKYCHADLFGSWIGLDKFHYFSGFGLRIFKCHIADVVLPLRPFKFKGFDFYIPNKTEELLTFQYGDWHTKNNGDWKHWPPGEIEYEISKGRLWELWTNNKKVQRGQPASSTKKYIRLNEDGTVDWDAGARLKIINDFLGHGKIVFWHKEEKTISFFDENKKQTDFLVEINEDHYESKDKILKKAKK
jgi:hypothetical protein